MHFLMCSSPLDNKKVDSCYQTEWAAAKKVGAVHPFDIDQLLLNKSCLARVPQAEHENTPIVYHGWMMTAAGYTLLYNQLQAKGYRLINTPEQYASCHYFDNWYPAIPDLTPNSLCIERTEALRPMLDKVLEYRERVNSPLVIKDSIKSLKHMWYEACFIPREANALEVSKVLATFFAIKDEMHDFNGSLVVRQFVNMKKVGVHEKSGMPLSQEYRCFVLYGKIIYVGQYWDVDPYDDTPPPIDLLEEIAGRIYTHCGNNLFTIDVGLLTNGKFVCMEVGDGQVSAIPEGANKEFVFEKIAAGVNATWQATSMPTQPNL